MQINWFSPVSLTLNVNLKLFLVSFIVTTCETSRILLAHIVKYLQNSSFIMFKVWRPAKAEPVILSDEEKQEKIKKLREMIKDTACELRTDDIYMTRWLHCRDWDVGAAFKRVMKFYYFKVSFCLFD